MNLPRTADILIYDLACLIRSQVTEYRPLLVCIDGLTGAGKTTFGEALKTCLRTSGTPAYNISVDHFHNPRLVRHSLGRLSPEGYYLHSHDYEKLRRLVIEPLRQSGSDCSIVPRVFDLEGDCELIVPPLTIQVPSVVIVEGSFTLRESLRKFWDFSLYLNASRELAVSRVASRDKRFFNSEDAAGIISNRYHGAHDLHETLNRPKQSADLCIDNSDPDRPVTSCLGDFRHRRQRPLEGKALVVGVSRWLRHPRSSAGYGRALPLEAGVRIVTWDDRPPTERLSLVFSHAAVEIDQILATSGHFLDCAFQCKCNTFCDHIAESISCYFGHADYHLCTQDFGL